MLQEAVAFFSIMAYIMNVSDNYYEWEGWLRKNKALTEGDRGNSERTMVISTEMWEVKEKRNCEEIEAVFFFL